MYRAIVAAIVLAGGLVVGGAHSTAAPAPGEGSLDAAFGTGGIVTTSIGGQQHSLGRSAVAVQPDGKIVVVGRAAMPNFELAVMRYLPDGSLDPGFGTGGTVTTQVGDVAMAYAVALQPDGKIVVAGASYATLACNGTLVLARFTPTGALDTGFGSGGVVTTAIDASCLDDAMAVAIQPDSKIVVAGEKQGTFGGSVGTAFALARYTSSGEPDSGFGTGGIVTTPFGTPSSGVAYAVALQPDGKIVLAGKAQGSFGGSVGTAFALARYTPVGKLDTGFGTHGVVTTPFRKPSAAEADAVALQPDGKIVAAGEAVVDYGLGEEGQYFALARYTAAGKLDTGFGTGGRVTTELGGGLGASAAQAVAIEPAGKIVAAGAYYDKGTFALVRYTTHGALDTHFRDPDVQSPRGIVTTPIGDAASAYGVALQPDGKIVAAGIARDDDNFEFAVARYIGDTTAPTNAHLVGQPRYSTALTGPLKWTASDADTGVRSYDLRYRYAGYKSGGFGSYHRWQTRTMATHRVFRGVAGGTYCFQVRAYDRAGNVGSWGRRVCTAYPVNDRTLVAAGTWKKLNATAYYLGTARRSTHSGAGLRLAVHYRHLAVIASTGPGSGTARVYLGRTLLKMVSLATASARHRVVVPVAAPSKLSSGTVRIIQSSSGKPVVIEGLAVSLA